MFAKGLKNKCNQMLATLIFALPILEVFIGPLPTCHCRMRATLTKIGEGAFADVFGCQKEGWDKLAIKVSLCHICKYVNIDVSISAL